MGLIKFWNWGIWGYMFLMMSPRYYRANLKGKLAMVNQIRNERKTEKKTGFKSVGKRLDKQLYAFFEEVGCNADESTPAVFTNKAGGHFAQLPASVGVGSFEKKALEGFNQIMGENYTSVRDHEGGFVEFIKSQLPDFVAYADRPMGAGIWLGTDDYNEPVFINFE
jgi:hypothetical protein